jgi:hypothetical protein
VSARDDAIQAMHEAGDPDDMNLYYVGLNECGILLDAIPDSVLVRLAIERGALAEVEIIDEWAGSSEVIDSATQRPVNGQLYRVVES